MIKSKNDWTVFTERSTCAAVVHLGERSQPILLKMLWKITLIAGITMTAVSTYYSTKDFMNLSGSSEMILQSNPTSRIEHPKFHICTTNTFNYTILEEIGFADAEMVSYLMLVTSLFVASPTLIENVEHQRYLEEKFDSILIKNNISGVNELIERALFKCEDIIAGCVAPGVYANGVDCCAKHFPTGSFVSTTGACVSTQGAPPFYQAIPSMAFGFVVVVRDLKDPRLNLDNSVIHPVLANQKGVSFAVGDKWTAPTVALFRQKHYTQIGLWTSLALSKTTVNDEEATNSILVKKTCAARNEPDKYRHLVPGFDNYTEINCNYARRQKRINEIVGCYVLTLPYKGNLPSCRPAQLLELAEKILTNRSHLNDPLFTNQLECVSECWKEMYTFSASHAELKLSSNFKVGNITILPNESDRLVALNFYYPTFMQTLLVNHYPTIPEWLGVLGGNVGLFLGASMVTLIEVLVFFFNCCRSVRRQ